MKIELKNNLIYINGEPIFIYSGEIHYFRIPFEQWEDRIVKAKEAGLNCISSYIPWIWHEPEENKFDFTGETLRERNIVKFIELVKKHDLFFIARIGPYFNAELIFDGLPVWLVEKKNIKHLSPRIPHLIQYDDPVFLNYVKGWYENLINSIKNFQLTKNGNIILFQLCNEIGVLNWLEKQPLNFNQPDLSCKVDGINENFEMLISFEKMHSKAFADYFNTLKSFALEFGVEVPFVVNVAQFEDYHDRGRAFDAILTAVKFEHFSSPDTILSGDFYPKRIDYDNFHDVITAIEILKTFSNDGNPVISMELQAGFIYDRPKIYPSDVELLTNTCFAHGLAGVNFYMFAGGLNYENVGVYGMWHDWQSPISWNGDIKQSFRTIKEIANNLPFNFRKKDERTKSGEFTKVYDICVGIYKPYFSTMFLKGEFIDEIETVRNLYFHDGILRLLTIANVNFKFIDIEKDDISSVDNLFLFAFDWMDEETQNKLVNFITTSGLSKKSLILFYDIPDKNLKGIKTDIFQTTLGIERIEKFYPQTDDYYKFIDMGNIMDDELFNDIPVFSRIATVKFKNLENNGVKIIAKFKNEIAGFVKKIRGNNFVFLGFGINQRYDYQIKIIRKILNIAGIKPKIICAPDDIHASLFKLYDEHYLFVANYHETEREAEITVRIDKDEEKKLKIYIEPRKSKVIKL